MFKTFFFCSIQFYSQNFLNFQFAFQKINRFWIFRKLLQEICKTFVSIQEFLKFLVKWKAPQNSCYVEVRFATEISAKVHEPQSVLFYIGFPKARLVHCDSDILVNEYKSFWQIKLVEDKFYVFAGIPPN